MNTSLYPCSGNHSCENRPPLYPVYSHKFSKNEEKSKEQLGKEAGLIALLRKKERLGYEMLYDSYAATLLGVINRIIPEQG